MPFNSRRWGGLKLSNEWSNIKSVNHTFLAHNKCYFFIYRTWVCVLWTPCKWNYWTFFQLFTWYNLEAAKLFTINILPQMVKSLPFHPSKTNLIFSSLFFQFFFSWHSFLLIFPGYFSWHSFLLCHIYTPKTLIASLVKLCLYILKNCRRALYKIRSYCLPLGQVPPNWAFNCLTRWLCQYTRQDPPDF